MKAIILISSMFVSQTIQAQGNYWVVETSTKSKSSIVRFYNAESLLLEELTLQNRKLFVTRAKDKRFLNRRLKEAERKYSIATAKK